MRSEASNSKRERLCLEIDYIYVECIMCADCQYSMVVIRRVARAQTESEVREHKQARATCVDIMAHLD